MNAFVPSSSRYGTNGEIAMRQPPARMITGARNRKRIRRPYPSLIVDCHQSEPLPVDTRET